MSKLHLRKTLMKVLNRYGFEPITTLISKPLVKVYQSKTAKSIRLIYAAGLLQYGQDLVYLSIINTKTKKYILKDKIINSSIKQLKAELDQWQ